MSAVCPACGVGVLPGYVRCPKCHAGLPSRAKRTTAEPGGTAVVEKGFPVSAVLVAVAVAAAIILVFGFRGSRKQADTPTTAAEIAPEVAVGTPRATTPLPQSQATAVVAPVAAAPAALDPRAAVAALEDMLRRQRLWGRAQITGARIDVRSGSCGDPGMKPAIAAEQSTLRGAGLTKLRCLEQSGAVVFERDL